MGNQNLLAVYNRIGNIAQCWGVMWESWEGSVVLRLIGELYGHVKECFTCQPRRPTT